MDTHSDPTTTTSPTYTEIRTDSFGVVIDSRTTDETGRIVSDWRMPEWRRRSLAGRNPFDAVADMTDRVAGR